MAIKLLSELGNGLLPSEACIKHLSSQASLPVAQNASLTHFSLLRADSPKQRCLFPLVRLVDVY